MDDDQWTNNLTAEYVKRGAAKGGFLTPDVATSSHILRDTDDVLHEGDHSCYAKGIIGLKEEMDEERIQKRERLACFAGLGFCSQMVARSLSYGSPSQHLPLEENPPQMTPLFGNPAKFPLFTDSPGLRNPRLKPTPLPKSSNVPSRPRQQPQNIDKTVEHQRRREAGRKGGLNRVAKSTLSQRQAWGRRGGRKVSRCIVERITPARLVEIARYGDSTRVGAIIGTAAERQLELERQPLVDLRPARRMRAAPKEQHVSQQKHGRQPLDPVRKKRPSATGTP